MDGTNYRQKGYRGDWVCYLFALNLDYIYTFLVHRDSNHNSESISLSLEVGRVPNYKNASIQYIRNPTSPRNDLAVSPSIQLVRVSPFLSVCLQRATLQGCEAVQIQNEILCTLQDGENLQRCLGTFGSMVPTRIAWPCWLWVLASRWWTRDPLTPERNVPLLRVTRYLVVGISTRMFVRVLGSRKSPVLRSGKTAACEMR